MGQFKPMVKMETTEPSVILKLKKGGHVNKKESAGEHGHKAMRKFDGGAMGALADTPALVGRPAVNAPVRVPGRPSMADRRAAMAARSAPRRPMNKGGAVYDKNGKTFDQQFPISPRTPDQVEKDAANSADKRMKTGGDVKEDKAMIKKAIKQHDAQGHKGEKGTKISLKTGGVAKGAAGYKKGGAAKKC